MKVKRVFLIDGTEITDLNMLGQDEQLFLSEGESFLPVSVEYSFCPRPTISTINIVAVSPSLRE